MSDELVVGTEITPAMVEQAITTGELDMPEVESNEDAHRAIVARILAADTPEALLQMTNTTPLQDMEGIALEVTDVRFMRSAYDEGPPIYALVDAVNLETGEAVTITTGSLNVLAQLVAAKGKGWLPIRGVPTPSKQTAAGFKAWWLAAPPAGLRAAAAE